VLPNLLSAAQTVVQSTGYCAERVQADGGIFNPVTSLCAINSTGAGTGTCHGDSGGPLMSLRATGTIVEIGITRSGDAHCSTAYPDVFTRVDTVSAWADGLIAAVQPPAKAVTARIPQRHKVHKPATRRRSSRHHSRRVATRSRAPRKR
jgi:secreted trypsin-like serine protease